MRLWRSPTSRRATGVFCALAALTNACSAAQTREPSAPPPASLGASSSASITQCAIVAGFVAWSPGVVLRTPSGAAFGRLVSGTDVRFATAPSDTLLGTASGVRLQLSPRPFELPLYPRVSVMFGGVVRAGPTTRLGWVTGATRLSGASGASGGTLTVKLATDDRVEWLGPTPLARAACTELALGPFTPSGASANRAAVGASGLRSLDLTNPVPIALTAGGHAIARLRAPSAQAVTLLEEKGELARIDWELKGGELAGAHVVGWVPGALLGTTRVGRASRRGCGFGTGTTFDAPGCKHAHPLWVRTANGLEPVGTVLAESRVRVTETFSPWVAVQVLEPAKDRNAGILWLEDDATFVMREEDARDCQ